MQRSGTGLVLMLLFVKSVRLLPASSFSARSLRRYQRFALPSAALYPSLPGCLLIGRRMF